MVTQSEAMDDPGPRTRVRSVQQRALEVDRLGPHLASTAPQMVGGPGGPVDRARRSLLRNAFAR